MSDTQAPDWAYDDDPFEADEDNTDDFDCPRYWTGEVWHCPLLGSKDCDWSCPNGGMTPE